MTRTINRKVVQIVMHHPRRGYKWLDQKTEPQHNNNGWRLAMDDEAEAWAKTQAPAPDSPLKSGKPVEVLNQRGSVLDPKQAEIDKLTAELAALKAAKIEIPLVTNSTAEPIPESEVQEEPTPPAKKKIGRPKKQPA